jgi:hypothetical protein
MIRDLIAYVLHEVKNKKEGRKDKNSVPQGLLRFLDNYSVDQTGSCVLSFPEMTSYGQSGN